VANEPVYKVMHTLAVGGGWGIGVSDLMFIKGIPHAILEWDGPPDKKLPLVSVKLDRARLSASQGSGADFLYDGVIEDPRKPS
jgi:hypothetical protein